MAAKKLLTRSILLPAILLFTWNLSFAQDKTISGKVTDSKDGSPVVGASVLAKGTTVGTSTNTEGNFSLSVPSSVATLVITSVGFDAIEVDIAGKTSVAVTLVGSAGSLAEIVVTGYGTQRRREVTSAITTVNAENFNKGNVSDVAQLLQGKAAGLSIARPGGIQMADLLFGFVDCQP